jgi:hypothetical protein
MITRQSHEQFMAASHVRCMVHLDKIMESLRALTNSPLVAPPKSHPCGPGYAEHLGRIKSGLLTLHGDSQ